MKFDFLTSGENERQKCIQDDSDFVFLKSELNCYLRNSKAPAYTLRNFDKSPSWYKALYINLNQLLTELILTEDIISQQALLKKIVQWYRSKVSSTDPAESSKKLTTQNQIKLPPVNMSPSTVNFLKPYTPKTSFKSSESSFLLMDKKFNDAKHKQISQAKAFLSRRSDINRWTMEKRRNNEDFVYKQDVKQYSYTPEPAHVKENHSERSICVDFRVSPTVSDTRFKDRIMNRARINNVSEQLCTIERIKKKLASRNVPVCSTCLENGFSLYDTYLDTSCKEFPLGGELLQKSPMNIKTKKNSTRTKRKKGKKPKKL